MKKIITTLLVSGVTITGLGIANHTLASTIQNGDGTQTVTGETSSSLDITGNIGQFDPETTDPEEPGVPGPGDDAWIKVKLPTSVAYYSTGVSKHKDITSANAEIENKSNYPVMVTLADFNNGNGGQANATGVETLNLNADGTAISLISNSTVSVIPTEMFKLGANPSGSHPTDNTSTPNVKTFNFSGKTDSIIDLGQLTKVNNNLDLTFTSLDENHNVVTP
jgi:hypothetical protein